MAVAAGVTFYVLLALFPGIAALVSLYGLFADPATISQHLSDLSGFMPEGATQVIGDQLKNLTSNASRHSGSHVPDYIGDLVMECQLRIEGDI